MMVIGSPGRVSRPRVTVTVGGVEIEATSFSSQFAAGQIAVARAGILPQQLADIPDTSTDQKCEVRIEDAAGGESRVLFKGYLSGISGSRGGRTFTAGVDMIHVARDLDNMRFGAPGVHPNGAMDYRYFKENASGNASKNYGEGLFQANVSFFEGGNLPSSVIKELMKQLQALGTTKATNGLKFREESLGPTIELLGSIIVKGGDLKSDLGNRIAKEINNDIVSRIRDSYNGQASLWDMLSTLFGEFGILMLCMSNGRVVITPDTSGLASTGDNFIGGDQILAFNHSSQFYRNIGGVDIVDSQVSPQGLSTCQLVKNSLISSYYPETGSNGASFVIRAPRFMSPLGTYINEAGVAECRREPPSPGACASGEPLPSTGSSYSPTSIMAFQKAYAKMIYMIERNKLRTFTATTPLMPDAFPGTVVTLQPYSSVHVRPEEGGSIGSSETFDAYCYSVTHNIDFKGKNISTNMQFRNVSSSSEPRDSEHPLYSCKPLSW